MGINRETFRPTPNLPSHAFDSYGILMPKRTHTRVITCAQVDAPCGQKSETGQLVCLEFHCGAHAHGWRTMVDVGTDIGQQRARYIIDHSARHWTAKQDGGLVTFTFAPDQECFTEHRVALDRAPIYTLGRGDWRSATRPAPVDGEEWLDRFRANQENLSAQHRMG